MGGMGLRLLSSRVSCAVVLAVVASLGQGAKTTTPLPPHPAAKSQRTLMPDAGNVTEGVYHNAFFAFLCKIPFGWVERTKDMQEGNDPGKGVVLLAVFERPPEAQGETVNSAVVIAAENVSSYPGLDTAADYFGPLTELTTSKGFKVVNEPYEYFVGAKRLVREDFSKDLDKLTVYQASVVMLAKGYVVLFTFLGGSEDEVETLIEGLNFAVQSKGGHAAPPK